jgi:hypothetical protein
MSAKKNRTYQGKLHRALVLGKITRREYGDCLVGRSYCSFIGNTVVIESAYRRAKRPSKPTPLKQNGLLGFLLRGLR